jgi:hypothetical protein
MKLSRQATAENKILEREHKVLTGRSYVKIEMLQEALVLVSAKSLLSVRIQADDKKSKIPVLAERFRQSQRYKKG